MYFERDDLTLILREEDLDEEVRAAIDAKEAKRLLDHLEQCRARMSSQWKARGNSNQKKIDSGDPYEYARVFKGLSRLQTKGDGLRAADRQHLQTSYDFLVEEIALALNKSDRQARKLIHARCPTAEASA